MKFKKGSTPKNKLTIEYIKSESKLRWGFELKSTEYKNNQTPLIWYDPKSGNTFNRSWGKLISGRLSPNNVNNYEKDKDTIENYKNLGYKLDMTKEEYLNSETQSGNKIFHIIHPNLKEAWDVKMGHFKSLAVSHLNQTGRSTGETILEQIFIKNNVVYEVQKKCIIKETLNFFDFYLPTYDTYIEYDGKQHFKAIKRWGGAEGLAHRKQKDKLKDEYVREVNSKIIRIPYTVTTQKEMISILDKELGTNLLEIKLQLNGNKNEIAEYYSSHSSLETAKKFDTSTARVSYCYKKVYGKNKVRNR